MTLRHRLERVERTLAPPSQVQAAFCILMTHDAATPFTREQLATVQAACAESTMLRDLWDSLNEAQPNERAGDH